MDDALVILTLDSSSLLHMPPGRNNEPWRNTAIPNTNDFAGKSSIGLDAIHGMNWACCTPLTVLSALAERPPIRTLCNHTSLRIVAVLLRFYVLG